MVDLDQNIQNEYDRVLDITSMYKDINYPNGISMRDVICTHFQIANHFLLEWHKLVCIGPRDLGLLQSAIFRQVVEFDGKLKWSSPFEICATLLYGLIMDHPFHDANKRTAFYVQFSIYKRTVFALPHLGQSLKILWSR